MEISPGIFPHNIRETENDGLTVGRRVRWTRKRAKGEVERLRRTPSAVVKKLRQTIVRVRPERKVVNR